MLMFITNRGDVRWFAAYSGIKNNRRVWRVNGQKIKKRKSPYPGRRQDMLYSKKAKLSRRNSIMAAVKKELKANNAYVAPEALKMLAETLDTSRYYHVKVIRNAEEATERLTLTNHETAHSWAGGDGDQEEGEVVFGQVEFGEDYSYEFFDNGNSCGPEEYVTDPEFNLNEPYIVIIKRHDWRSWENDGCNYDDYSTTIVVYSPEKIYDEVEYAAEKDAELAELCQLREKQYNLPNALAQ